MAEVIYCYLERLGKYVKLKEPNKVEVIEEFVNQNTYKIYGFSDKTGFDSFSRKANDCLISKQQYVAHKNKVLALLAEEEE